LVEFVPNGSATNVDTIATVSSGRTAAGRTSSAGAIVFSAAMSMDCQRFLLSLADIGRP